MAEYTTAATVVEGMAGKAPIEKTYEECFDIKVSDGHLALMRREKTIAVYAPGSWLSVYRTEAK